MLSLLFALLVLPLQEERPPAPTGFPGLAVGKRPRVETPWNRLYDVEEIYSLLDRLQMEWPEFVGSSVLGTSVESRDLRLYTIHNPKTGPDEDKPAMWIDGNVHGNEVQGAEAVVYTAWYLLENYTTNERVRALVDDSVFYLLPMVNPDGRWHWFHEAHNASSSRSGYRPVDDDQDGLADEDPPNDLDGDGQIVQMRKYLPGQGTHRLNADDPRVMERVPDNDKGIRGDWILLGREGIDDDGDGRINEDPPGGYDMNRAWPALWQPGHVQYGAGPYPLYWPETRSIAGFLVAHPNVAAVQSFHNAGGMILVGPGAENFGDYPREDVRVYDELGKEGEAMLPFYRYMVIWKDLYTVFGGFVNWTYEGLGMISFTNELWSDRQLDPDRRAPEDQRMFLDDSLRMGEGFVNWHPLEHPLYGTIEVGGFKKDVGRVPPSFMIEEMLHRNALFCLRHAGHMPHVKIDPPETTGLGGGLTAVDVVFRNERLIPTRTRRAADKKIGTPDIFEIKGPGIEILAGGFRDDRFRPESIELADREPERLLSEEGIGSRGEVRVRWIVRGSGRATVAWRGEKARDVEAQLELH
jgi:hypothetical protein